jgi:hypothetical protein
MKSDASSLTTNDRDETAEAIDRPVEYEPELAECRVNGTVPVEPGVYWSGKIAVPFDQPDRVCVELERHTRDGSHIDEQAALTFPVKEVGCLVTLVSGIVAHAHRLGLLSSEPLPRTPSDSPDPPVDRRREAPAP